MDNNTILSLIDAEISRLSQVRALLASTGKVEAKLKARGIKKIAAAPAVAKTKAKKSRVLSPEARKRIADAQRKRWAEKKGKKEE
jgi:Spy/CpxP family protein refolding chaperone